MLLDAFAHEVFRSLSVTRKTRENYAGAYRRYVQPHLGMRELDTITRADVTAILDSLPAPSAYQTLMMLKTVFREAHELGLITQPPTDRIKAKRVVVPPKPFLRWETISLTDFGDHNDHVRFLALHGLRWGEAVALEESDIRDGRVHVWRSVHGAPKSAAGVRTVPYLGHFTEFDPDRRPLAKSLQPHGVTIHSLRKTYAYLLKANGVHVSTAQRLLGHASVALTLSVYTAVLDDEIDEAGQRLLAATTAPPPPQHLRIPNRMAHSYVMSGPFQRSPSRSRTFLARLSERKQHEEAHCAFRGCCTVRRSARCSPGKRSNRH